MRIAFAIAAVFACSSGARGQVVSRISVDSSGLEADGDSGSSNVYQQRPVAISADGNVVAFQSVADDLVAGDKNGFCDVFVHDRTTGITERVSVATSGVGGDDASFQPALSADGRFVAFWSYAANLVGFDTNQAADVFVRDRLNSTTERVSLRSNGDEGDGGSYRAVLSADGRFVAFESDATNLVFGDTNQSTDIFVRDRQNAATRRMSVDSAGNEANPGGSFDPALSADGKVVAFSSRADNLVAGDTNLTYDVFVHVRGSGNTTRVSVDSAGNQSAWGSVHPALSSNGDVVAFESGASDLVAGDTNGFSDVFVHVRSTGVTERVSVSSAGAEGDGHSTNASLSADGQIVAFATLATNLAPYDANGVSDVLVRDRAAGTTTLASFDGAWNAGDAASDRACLSDDGQIVAFGSFATTLIDADSNGVADVFVDDRAAAPLDATWNNYGSGFAGTLGVPTFAPSADPVVGTKITLDASNSSGAWSVGLALVGLQSASIPTSAGGTLLVDPQMTLLFGLPPAGASIPETIPHDRILCGLPIFLQALELDAGALHGISFTPGLELVVGH
jgi:Tol biopolymer transport system component